MPANPKVIDKFNVDGEDYVIEPEIDPVPIQNSQRAVMSGGVYDEFSRVDGDIQDIEDELSTLATETDIEDTKILAYKAAAFRRLNGSNIPTDFGGVIVYTDYAWDGPTRVNRYIATCSTGGLYWSDDGNNWTKSSSFTNAHFGIIYLPKNVFSNTVGLLASDYTLTTYGYQGSLYWSEDGKTWTKCTGLQENAGILQVAITRRMGSSIRAIATNGTHTFSSVDGKSWTELTMPANVDFTAIVSSEQALGGIYAYAYSSGTSDENKGLWCYNTSSSTWVQTLHVPERIGPVTADIAVGAAVEGVYGLYEDGVKVLGETENIEFDIAYQLNDYLNIEGLQAVAISVKDRSFWYRKDGTWHKGAYHGKEFTQYQRLEQGRIIRCPSGMFTTGRYWSKDGMNWYSGSGPTVAGSKACNDINILGVVDGVLHTCDYYVANS